MENSAKRDPKTSEAQRELVVHLILKRRQRKRDQKRQRQRSFWSGLAIATVFLLVGLLVVAIGGIIAAVGVYVYYARDLPPPNQIAQVRQQFETTLLYDRTGKTVLYQVLDPAGDRQYVPLSEVPKNLINATIAMEDKSFYTNPGFDIRGIARSVTLALENGPIQGASTITQQLVKNNLIPPEERTAISQDRKIKEIILAAEISRLYSKDQIMEWYLNTNFYGTSAYGIGTAARAYFGKRVQDITLGEAAMLVAIPQNPQFNPIDDWVSSRQRQAIVLDGMVSAGFITRDQATEAASQTIVIQPLTERYGIVAPHFSLYARKQAEQILDSMGMDGSRMVRGNGLRIYTTLDLDLFYQAECTMRGYVERIAGGNPTAAPNTSAGQPCTAASYLPKPPGLAFNKQRNVTNSSAVIIRPNTGEILAMVGSLDYYNIGIQGTYNSALGLRQPGSTFKPFVYVTAFASPNHDYTPAKLVFDVPTTYNQDGILYTPRNEDNQFHGPMSVREALANSYNIPAVSTMRDVTIGQVLRRARQLGLNTLTKPLDQYGLALALGAGEVTLTDLTYANTPFANLGYMAGTPAINPRVGFRTFDPVSVLRIDDRNGRTLWKLDEKRPDTFGRQNVLSDGLAYLINDILSDNQARLAEFKPGNALELSRPAAVKTGTTNDNRDAWTVGFTPQIVTGVWVGNNNNTSMGDDMTGGNAAAPIWHAIMEYIHRRDSLPVETWKRPSTIVEMTICKQSGLLPTAFCPTTKEIFYVDPSQGVSTAPTRQDIYWKRYRINSRNGLLATAVTPADLVTNRVYYVYPPEARDWAAQAGMPLPPEEYDSAPAAVSTVSVGDITTPGGLARVRGKFDVRGTISDNVTSYVLEYGVGIIPDKWFAIPGGETTTGDDIRLGTWDTAGLSEGLYTLRLGLTLKDGTFQPRTVQVTVDNQPPTITFTAPKPDAIVSASAGVVKLEATAADDIELDRVEFYWNDQIIATVSGSGPFTTEWRIVQLGEQTFYAIAYDTAGNVTRGESLKVNISN